jgi:hypothetical protein
MPFGSTVEESQASANIGLARNLDHVSKLRDFAWKTKCATQGKAAAYFGRGKFGKQRQQREASPSGADGDRC